MSRKDEIKSAYKGLGKAHSFYDGQMLGTTRIGRWMLRHVWGMTKEDALEYEAMALEAIPAGFSGRLLEVPVGTGVISMPVFKILPNADITCLDYSEKMMAALSFLGIGVQPPQASLGNLLNGAESISVLTGMPWLWVSPGVLIILVICTNFIGDALRDAVDPSTTK